MSTIKKNHRRFGAKVGDVVEGYECVERGLKHHDVAQGYEEGNRRTRKRDRDKLKERPCGTCAAQGRPVGPTFTRWRRVRVNLRRERDMDLVATDDEAPATANRHRDEHEKTSARSSGMYRTKTGEMLKVADSRVDRFIRAARDLGAEAALWTVYDIPNRYVLYVAIIWRRHGDDSFGTMVGSCDVASTTIERGEDPETQAQEVVGDLRKRANDMAREKYIL